MDRGTANVNDLLVALAVEVNHGRDQCMSLTFWDKKTSFAEITSDSGLIDALDLY